MSSFLHEHWKWIVGSIAFVVAAIVLIMLIGGDKDMSPFQYSQY
jgi:hypothetical protein